VPTILIRKAPVPLAVSRLPASDEAAWRALHAIADRLRPELQRRLRDMLAQAQRGLTRQSLESLLVSVSEPEMVTALVDAWDLVVRAQIAVQVQPVLQEIVQQAAIRARTSFTASLERLRIPPEQVTTRLTGDLMAPRAALWAEQHSGSLVTQITQTTRDALGTAVRDAMAHGRTIGQLQREVRGIIEQVPITTPLQTPAQAASHVRALTGLTPRQVGQVKRFREGLIARGMTGDKLVARVERQTSQLLRQRAALIARTESMTAAAAGQQALWEAAEREGLLDSGRARRMWVLTPDDRTCFLAGTLVMTPNGERPIEALQPGDIVCTQEGQQQLLATTARDYRGVLVLAATTHGRLLIMTADHLVWSRGHWQRADALQIGSEVQTFTQQFCHIERVVHLDFGEADDYPSSLLQGRGFAHVAFKGLLMPIDAIDFEGNAEFRQQEIDGRADAGDFALLDERYRQAFQSFSDGFFQPCFSTEAAIAGKRAETFIRVGGTPPDGCAALAAGDVDDISMATGQRADRISFSNNPGNGKRLLAYLTDLRDRFFFYPSIIASSGTKTPSFWQSFCWKIKDDAAMFACKRISFGFLQTKALPRTIRISSIETITSGELLSAMCAGIGKRHVKKLQELIKELITNYTITVYDITVEKEHHFFAEDILVHNCSICRAIPGMNPDGVGLHEPFQTPIGPIMHPAAHPACRCAVVLTFARRRLSPYTPSLLAAD
jgi:hypothetical protein